MTQFRYRAVSAAGEVLQGQMEAASLDEVVSRLQDQGHTPLDARAADSDAGGSGIAGWFKRGPFTGESTVTQIAPQPADTAISTRCRVNPRSGFT